MNDKDDPNATLPSSPDVHSGAGPSGDPDSTLPTQPDAVTDARDDAGATLPSMHDVSAAPFTVPDHTITARLAAGGMATIYTGVQTGFERRVAIKVMSERFADDEALLKRFEREAQTSSRFSHPNIVPVHAYGLTSDGRPFISMEYLDEGSLRDRLDRDQRLSPLEAVRIVRALASALVAVHKQRVIHRDIKPENVLFRAGTPALTDFGIAKVLDAGTELTQQGSPGTARYMAPEQIRGHGVEPAADIYSLGVVLYEMLCGSPPFMGQSLETVILQVVSEPPGPLPEELAPLQPLMDVLLVKDPEFRIQDAAELERVLGIIEQNLLRSDDLQHTLNGVDLPSVAARGTQPMNPVPPTNAAGTENAGGTHRTLAIATGIVGVLAVVALGAGGWFLLSDQGSSGNRGATQDTVTVPGSGTPAVSAPGSADDPTAQAPDEMPAPIPDTGASTPPIAGTSPFRDTLRSGGDGPDLVILEGGTFSLGCSAGGRCPEDELPVRELTLAPFAMGQAEVTIGEFAAFVQATGHDMTRADAFSGCRQWDGRRNSPSPNLAWDQGPRDAPVACVSASDAEAYVQWLSAETGARYRLPSEAEWEYAARGDASGEFFFGREDGRGACAFIAATNLRCGTEMDGPRPVGDTDAANPFGLYHVVGNLWEWTADCAMRPYRAMPADGAAYVQAGCSEQVVRGGAWFNRPPDLRHGNRHSERTSARLSHVGFRVARTLD